MAQNFSLHGTYRNSNPVIVKNCREFFQFKNNGIIDPPNLDIISLIFCVMHTMPNLFKSFSSWVTVGGLGTGYPMNVLKINIPVKSRQH